MSTASGISDIVVASFFFMAMQVKKINLVSTIDINRASAQ